MKIHRTHPGIPEDPDAAQYILRLFADLAERCQIIPVPLPIEGGLQSHSTSRWEWELPHPRIGARLVWGETETNGKLLKLAYWEKGELTVFQQHSDGRRHDVHLWWRSATTQLPAYVKGARRKLIELLHP